MHYYLKSSHVVLPQGIKEAAIEVCDGKIKSVNTQKNTQTNILANTLATTIDLGNYAVMPGLVDTHAHINEPGRTEWEGFETATKACAAGGITTVIDMPLNSIPATTTLDALKVKQREASGKCFVDYGFWGGVVPGNADELLKMVDAGVMGFKAFMCESGVEEFKFSKDKDLRVAMPVLKKCGMPLLVHAELEGVRSVSDASDVGKYQGYLSSRPREWENNAIKKIMELIRESSCRTHIVHLSSSDALPLIAEAKAQALPLTVETCPHYLFFVSEEIPDGATHFKCAPPIRERENREKLWDGIRSGLIDFVVSDHSPCTPALKCLEKRDFSRAWGGISSIQFSLPALWTQMKRRGFDLPDLTRLMCENTAKFAGLFDTKGSIEVGKDADFIVFDPQGEFVLNKSMIWHRHDITPYEGKKLCGRILKTFLRGEMIFDEGKFLTKPMGLNVRRGGLKV